MGLLNAWNNRVLDISGDNKIDSGRIKSIPVDLLGFIFLKSFSTFLEETIF